VRRSLLFALGVLVVLAGCSTLPFDGSAQQDRPVTVVMNNTANSTHSFEVWVVKAPSTATTQLDDGRTGNYTIGQGLRSHSSGDAHVWTDITFHESARSHGQTTLEPDESNQRTIEELPRDFAVVAVVYRAENEIIEWVSAYCGDRALVGLEVTARPESQGGVFASYGCR
jgi:ABC-type Zn uptake system ZnuABC Zn-binding protein ZnuA